MSKPTVNLSGILTEKAAPSDSSPRQRSLSMKVDAATYKRLRQFSLDRDMSHQDILMRALIAFLDTNA